MKTILISFTAFFLLMTPLAQAQNQTVVDFEELNSFDATLPNPFGFQLLGAGDVFNGFAAEAPSGEFESKGARFVTQEFGPGFSFSRFVDTSTPGFTNIFSAFPGGGSDGSGNAIAGENYGLVATGTSTEPDGTPTNEVSVLFDTSVDLSSIDIANTTYAARYFLNGLDGFDPEPDSSHQFSDEGDFFAVVIEGADADGNSTGSDTIDLARFTGGNLEFIDRWETIELDGFENTQSLSFSLASSDFDSNFGLNIPAFLAIDNLTFTAVPEPNSATIFIVGILFAGLTRFRKS